VRQIFGIPGVHTYSLIDALAERQAEQFTYNRPYLSNTRLGTYCERRRSPISEKSCMRDITRIDSGPRMSGAVRHNNTVYVSGQVALDAGGETVTVQTRNILSRIDALLAKAGTDKSRLLSASIWLRDMATFEEFNAVWDTWVVAGSTPARATVESKLAAPKFTVEIAVIAAV
jgi:enamine deaminase RidA (YjgF/YER057c/UK114 family)